MVSMARTGRPPLDPDKRLGPPVPVRFTDHERAIVEQAAQESGLSLSAWIRGRAIAAAKRSNRSTPPS
ncbi:plasmid mobilization protein [Mycobacteroides abscessus]|uniref:plasmid mobilization protein n=1 Tax=Mycobacteroides abscessus TaxID=36809 RepID=UPI003B437271